MNRCYFDHNATTPVSPEVLQAYSRALAEIPGNPSSVHHFGQRARQALDDARSQIAAALACKPGEIVFTSGGTEADNLAIFGASRAAARRPPHIVTSSVEHPAVLAACAQLEKEGASVTYLPVDGNGLVDPDGVRRALRPETVLISIMHANNETGVIQRVEEIARIAHEQGIPFHCDGVQAAGKIAPCRECDLYSISGHKIFAPKGIGALVVRNGVKVQPVLYGGRQERARRAGTENVPGAVALAAALSSVDPAAWARIAALRERMEASILDSLPGAQVNGAGAPRLPNTSNIRIPGVSAEALVIALDLEGFAVSTGSACSSGAVEPSHVLKAMGLPANDARASVRISLGPSNTEEQVAALAGAVVRLAQRLRRTAPEWSVHA